MVAVEKRLGDDTMNAEISTAEQQEDLAAVEEPLIGQITLDELLGEIRIS